MKIQPIGFARTLDGKYDLKAKADSKATSTEMRTVQLAGFIVEGLDVLSLGCLLDIPVEILSRKNDCEDGVQSEAETRGINLGLSDIRLVFKTTDWMLSPRE